jgi:uncharacterized protein YycO
VIELQFVRGTQLSSRAIGWFGAGYFSHVDAIDRDGYLWGSRSDRVGGMPPGFQRRPPNYERWRERRVLSLKTTPAQARAYWDFLCAQVGKPYDYTAIWGFAAGRNWRDTRHWFCSEVQAAAGEAALIVPTLWIPENKIMPGTLATIYSALGASLG